MVQGEQSTINHTELLIEEGMVNLFEAIIHKNTKKVKYTLEQGANPNSIIDASGL